MESFAEFFELEIQERGSKIFKTQKRLERLTRGESQDAEEETAGTAIQNSNDNVEDIVKRNIIDSQDIPLEKIRFFFDFRMPSLVNCRKLLASITKNFDRKSGTIKVFGLKNYETGDIEYVLLDGTHRYICYKYLQKKTVPADVLKETMEEWEWFYIAGGGNVISSTHVPMDIYSKIKLIGEIMEKKVNGKVLTANEAKPIIQKNVPGFQDKCSKESINSYNRIYRSYKGKYLNMVQQVVMKKETKSHSMVKDNLELPSLMSLEDSPFKEELFRKMGESKMNKDEIITLINRNKLVRFVEDRLEDTEEEALKKNIIRAIESGKYDTWLVREDAPIRDGQIEGTKLWGKIEKLLSQQNPTTNSKGEEEDEHQGNKDEQLVNNNKRKRQSDTKWESRLAKKRKNEQNHTQQSQDSRLDTERDIGNLYSTPATHLSNIKRVAASQGPVRFRPPRSFKVSISIDEEYQFATIDGELYISLTCIPHDKYKQLEDEFRSKNLNNSAVIPVSQKSSVKGTTNTNNNSISLFEEEDDEGEVLLLQNSTDDGDLMRLDTDTSGHHHGSKTPNNNNNSRKSFSSVQSVGSYLFEGRGDNDCQGARENQELELEEDNDRSRSSENNKARKEKEKDKKKEKEKSKKQRSGKKDKGKKHKKDTNTPKSRSERKSKKPVAESKEAQSNHVEQNNSNDKEDMQEEDEDEEKEQRSFGVNSEGKGEKQMEIDSYEHHFDNDDDDDDVYDLQSCQQVDSKREEQEEKEGTKNDDDQGSNEDEAPLASDDDDEDMESADFNANNNNDRDSNSEVDHSTLEKHVKRYYGKISRIFNGKDSTSRLKQWKSGIRKFTRRSGGYSISDLKIILALLKEWSKHFNRVKPKFEKEEELHQFVVDVLWYEVAHRLLSDKHGVSLKEAKVMLEKSSELVIN